MEISWLFFHIQALKGKTPIEVAGDKYAVNKGYACGASYFQNVDVTAAQ